MQLVHPLPFSANRGYFPYYVGMCDPHSNSIDSSCFFCSDGWWV